MTREQCHTCKDRYYAWCDIEKGDFKQNKKVHGRFIIFECVSEANEDTDLIESYILDIPCKQYRPKEREKKT